MIFANGDKKMEIVEQAEAALACNGFHVFRAPDSAAACDYLVKLAGVGPVVKSYSATLKAIGLAEFFRCQGVTLLETRLADYLAAAEGLSPVDSFSPLEGMEASMITGLLKKHFDLPEGLTYDKAAELARSFIREQIAKASLGITGANAIIVETGSIAIIEEQGNARLVSNLPPIHAVVATAEKIISTMAGALESLRNQSFRNSGRQMTKYMTFISGPSKTGDIGFNLVKGIHGPGEVHVILINK